MRRSVQAQLRKEAKAQIQKIRLALGAERSLYLDSHQHVHMIPFIFDELLRLGVEHSVSRIRFSREPFFFCKQKGAISTYFGPPILKHSLLRFLSFLNHDALRRSQIPYCDYTIGVLFSGRMTPAVVQSAFETISRRGAGKKAVEVVFHPGKATPDELVSWTSKRQALKFYCAPMREQEAVCLKQLR